jgi:FkbM family methyltransferase
MISIIIKLNNVEFPFYFRTGSRGDIGVIKQIFFNQGYKVSHWTQGRALTDYYNEVSSFKTPIILDAGANIGASCAYFKAIYPNALLYAVEPVPSNLHLLKLNLAKLGGKIFEGALSLKDHLFLHDPGSSDWGFQVKEVGDSQSVTCVSPSKILSSLSPSDVALIFKIDIEGSEQEVFSQDVSWIDSVALIVVEIHDWMLPGTSSSHPFLKAILNYDFDILIRGENVFCFNNKILKKYYKNI